MPSFKRPGVYAEEILLSPQATQNGSSVSVNGAFIGTNNRGPVVPTFISTWSEYTAYFGGFSPLYQLPFALYQYFANGGRGVYVTRVPGVGAATATRTLLDRGGSAANTLSVTALNPGAWGNTLFLDITNYGVLAANRFSITLHLGDTTASTIVETWNDLSMDPTDARYVVNVLNAGNNAGSKYVVVANLNSANPLSQAAPAVQAGTVLAGGTDGTAAGATEHLVAINAQDQILDPFVLNLPGVADTTTLTNAINYAANRTDVFVVCDTVVGLTSAGAISAAAALPTSTYAASYWPWILVNDPSVSTYGVTKLVPPGPSVVGQMMTTDTSTGVWKAPAGSGNRIVGAVGQELKLTNADLDALNTAVPPVNALRNITGTGICIMGTRTLDPTSTNMYIPVRRTLIYLKAALKQLMTPAMFEPNNQVLWTRLTNDIGSFLTSFWQAGGLNGSTPQQAFYVKCDSTLNTNSVIQAGQVIAEVGVSTLNPAEFVVLRIGQTNGVASATSA